MSCLETFANDTARSFILLHSNMCIGFVCSLSLVADTRDGAPGAWEDTQMKGDVFGKKNAGDTIGDVDAWSVPDRWGQRARDGEVLWTATGCVCAAKQSEGMLCLWCVGWVQCGCCSSSKRFSGGAGV